MLFRTRDDAVQDDGRATPLVPSLSLRLVVGHFQERVELEGLFPIVIQVLNRHVRLVQRIDRFANVFE